MDEESNTAPDESLIINRLYFEALKDQFHCPICLCLLTNPLMCSNCETSFCKKCIKQWLTQNDTCPMRCPKSQSNMVSINRTIKKNLDGLYLKCRYGCEVPFLSYNSHVNFSHKDDVKCWNCEKISNKSNIKILKEDNIESKEKIKKMCKDLSAKEEEIIILKDEVVSKNKEIIDLKNKIGTIIDSKNKEREKELLILKAKNEDLELATKMKENEILSLKEKIEEQKNALKPKKGEIHLLKSKIQDYEEALKLFFSLDLIRDQIKTSESLVKKIKEALENPIKKIEFSCKTATNSNCVNSNTNKNEDLRESMTKVDVIKLESNLDDWKSQEKEISNNLKKLLRTKSSLLSLKFGNSNNEYNEADEREIEKIKTSFKNVKKVSTKDYQFFNENKTIRKMRENRVGIYCVDKVKSEGIQEFTIKIDNLSPQDSKKTEKSVSGVNNLVDLQASFICIGYTVFGTCPNEGLCNTKSSWMCCLTTGGFYNGGDFLEDSNNCFKENNNWIKPVIGDTYSICVDFINEELFIKKNGKVVSQNQKMLINKKQKKNLYPCVDIVMPGTAITLFEKYM